MSVSADLLGRLVDCVGPENALTAVDDLTRYTHENRNIFVGKTPLVLKPANTDEVAEIMKIAFENAIAVVPQGGHTGHVGGAVPDESGDQIVISMERMNRIRAIDPEANFVIAEAGVILENLQQAADERERLFPLSLAAQGSCQIGGNISTNAGGTGVLAYGSARDQLLGLEVVLPDGQVWNGLTTLKKDNTGYDLKQLFAGAEGTLGIITACALRLLPKPQGKSVAITGLWSPDQALLFFNMAKSRAGSSLTAFELMPQLAFETTCIEMDSLRNPFQDGHSWYALVEISSDQSEEDARMIMDALLESALEADLIQDAVISDSIEQQKSFWQIRELMPVAQNAIGATIKHDISVAVHRVPEFLDRAKELVKAIVPGARLYAFGHMGDGNIHFNVMQPEGSDTEAFISLRQEMNDAVHELVDSMDGSISAEHGIGRLKRDVLARTKDPQALAIMSRIKMALDPKNIMNPGKLL